VGGGDDMAAAHNHSSVMASKSRARRGTVSKLGSTPSTTTPSAAVRIRLTGVRAEASGGWV
jgi:hypothetical protein